MRSEGGTGGHAGAREGKTPLQMSLFEDASEDRT